MNFHYAFTQLIRRPGRSVGSLFSVSLGIMLFISLQAYADGYRQAARAPLTQIGADLAAQRQGNVPDKFEGIVFPHSVAPIHRDEIDQIRKVPGVQAIAEVLFFWDFEPAGFIASLGVDPADNFGPGRLRTSVVAGRFLQAGDQWVAEADTTFAQQTHLSLRNTVQIAGKLFTVVGLADTTRAGQLANANLYIPLSDARSLSDAAPQVRSVFDIRPDDANLLFIKLDQVHSEAAARSIQAILGEKATVTTGQSFAAELGALFDLIGLALGGLATLGLGSIQIDLPGLTATTPTSLAFQPTVYNKVPFLASLSPQAILLSLGVAVLGGSLASWLVARRAASIKPAVTLRQPG